MALTQQVIADHVGISQQKVGSWLRKLGLDESTTLDEFRLAYCAALREEASSAAPSSERNLWYRARRRREELKLAREERELVPVEVVLGSFGRSVHGVKQRIFGLPTSLAPKLQGETDAKKVADTIRSALHECFEALASGQIQKIVEDACELINGERK